MTLRRNEFSPAEYGERLAAAAPPLTPEQIENAARILVTVEGPPKDQEM